MIMLVNGCILAMGGYDGVSELCDRRDLYARLERVDLCRVHALEVCAVPPTEPGLCGAPAPTPPTLPPTLPPTPYILDYRCVANRCVEIEGQLGRLKDGRVCGHNGGNTAR